MRSSISGSNTSAKNAVCEGKYANCFKVGHNAFEFLIDFGQYNSEAGEVDLISRIYTGPAYAKALLRVIQQSVRQFEDQFGPIDENPK